MKTIILGCFVVEGVSRKTEKPYRFYDVSLIPPEVNLKGVGERVVTYQCFDEEVAAELMVKLREAQEAGVNYVSAEKIISHYSNGRTSLDYIFYKEVKA